MKRIFTLLIILLSTACEEPKEIYGCTDSNYDNFDPQATIDDGSCDNIPVQMVALSGGTFTMGDIWGVGSSNELPTHEVTLSSFEMSATEITNQQYADYQLKQNGNMQVEKYPQEKTTNGQELVQRVN